MTGGQENRLLAHVPCCHTKGDTIRVGLKDRRGRKENFFFPPPLRGGMLSLLLARDGRWEVVEERVERGVTGKTDRGRCVLQTALNGRPKAGGVKARGW